MTPRLAAFSLCSAIALPLLADAARGAEALRSPISAAKTEAPEGVRAITRRQFSDAATPEIGILNELRSWRNTLRGQGARREWSLAPLREQKKTQKLALSLGNVAPSTFGGGAGIAAKWRGVEIGSTAQPEALDEALSGFDSFLTGEKGAPAAQKRTQLNWLRAQLASTPSAQVEIMAARASRDLAGTNPSWREGDFGSASANFKLPSKWSLSGNYQRAEVERAASASAIADENAASAWSLAAGGPVAHPFGVAQARATWRSMGEGYVAPTSENGAEGIENGSVELAQDVKIGRLTGKLQLGAATQRDGEPENALAGQQLEQNSARSTAQMRLALTPNLSLTGNGQWHSVDATRALIDQKSAPNVESDASFETLLTPTQTRELSRQMAGDFGVQWNFSKALSLAVSLGVSSQGSRAEIGDDSNLGPQSDEVRRALEVRQKSGDNDFRIRFSQRERKNSLAMPNLSDSSGDPISQWRVEAARPLIGSVRLKTIVDYASDAANSQSARRLEAQLQLARAARFDARYREGNLAPGLMSDEWSSTFASSSSAAKQVSARFGLGSAASGAGLGLSMEMVRSQGALPDSYRVGLQFK